MLVVSVEGDLALLIHLMSAGRLQLFDTRASLRDRTSRLLLRLADGRRAAAARVRDQAGGVGEAAPAPRVDEEESVATLGPEAWPTRPRTSRRCSTSRAPLHGLLRDQR